VVHSPAWFPDGERIAVAGTPEETLVWDVRDRNVGGGLPADSASRDFGFTGAWYTRDDSAVILSRLRTSLSLVDLDTTSEIARQAPADVWVDWPGLPIVSTDRSLVAMSDEAGLMTIYDTESLAPLRTFEAGVPIDVFSPDGDSIVVAPRVGSDPVPADVRPGLVDIATGEFIFTFDELDARLWNDVLAIDAAFHPSGDYVAVTGPTRVYDTRSGEVVFAPEPWGNALAFSLDGSRFAILTEAGFAYLYDFDAALAGATPDEAQIRAWQALDATGLVVRWTEDGSRLLVGGMDDRLVVFDGEGQETLVQIPTGPVATIDFTRDGRSALVSGLDGPRIVPLETDDLLNMARARLTRGFTPAECTRFFPGEDCSTLEELRVG